MKIAQDVIAVALAEVGVKEGPNNDTKFGRWYGLKVGQNWNHQPYCAIFVSWCYAQAGHSLPEMQAPGYSGFASANIGLDYLRRKRQLTDKPQTGDLVFFDFQQDGYADHVGLVLAINPDKSVVTIEGNTGKPEGVYIRIRQQTGLIFAHPVPTDILGKGPCWVNNSCPV